MVKCYQCLPETEMEKLTNGYDGYEYECSSCDCEFRTCPECNEVAVVFAVCDEYGCECWGCAMCGRMRLDLQPDAQTIQKERGW